MHDGQADVHDLIIGGAFENALPYPTKPFKPTISLGATAAQARNYADALEAYESEYEAYKIAIDNWRKTDRALKDKFKILALEEVGLTSHPKANEAFNKASENSGTLTELLDELNELADLMLN